MNEMKKIPQAIASAEGLASQDAVLVKSLYELYQKKLLRNLLRDSYYEMKQRPSDLGISVPPNLRSLEQVIGWPAKAVDSLANRSILEGFPCDDEQTQAQVQEITLLTNLKNKYQKAVRSELKHSCSFLAVTATDDGYPQINAYPATASSALWSDRLGRVVAGMVVVDRDNTSKGKNRPVWVDVYTDDAIISIQYISGKWVASYQAHSIGRCLMEALAHNATLDRPMGTSRISRAVMNITDSAMRASVRSEISAEFFTSPQKYLLGADKEALNGQSKWDAYIGNIFAVAKDKDGDVAQFGQLSQGTMQPHIDYMRSLAARFAGETNVPISELGVIHDNPSSADAIRAATEPLVIDAQNLNRANGASVLNVMNMARAILLEKSFYEVVRNEPKITCKFKNPALPSFVSQSDAITKAISALPWLADSDVALEEYGFSDEQIQRLVKDRKNAKARELAAQIAQRGLNDTSRSAQ